MVLGCGKEHRPAFEIDYLHVGFVDICYANVPKGISLGASHMHIGNRPGPK
jgi:hypothetical protein